MNTNSPFASFLATVPQNVLDLLNTAKLADSAAKQDKVEEPKPRGTGKGKKSGGEKSEKKGEIPIVQVVAAPTVAQDPAAFLSLMRHAGIRQVERVNPETSEIIMIDVFDPITERADQRAAVSAYCGWTSEPHGTQVDRAFCNARFRILPSGGKWLGWRSPEAHNARASVEGFVAGMPNALAKVLADLSARVRVADEELVLMTHLWDNMEAASGPRKAIFDKYLAILARDEPATATAIKTSDDRVKLITTLLIIAQARAEGTREELHPIISGDYSPETIHHAAARLNDRGLPSFEEGITVLNDTLDPEKSGEKVVSQTLAN